jgi:ribosomal protein S8
LKAIWNQEADKVAELLENAHNKAGNKTYHDEAALSYAVQLAYYAAQKYYTTILELDSGKGYVDLAYLPAPGYEDKPALVVELKYNGGVGAIQEISVVSRPGRRVYSGCAKMPKVLNGLGIAIVSTPCGVMTDHKARLMNVGGEVLCKVI